ncbi:MAG: hypothetical protein GXP15_12565 [Gammaproteobacteria bacterium]|nr:hypothetical protein [Gammaproteobacteria bacterium]
MKTRILVNILILVTIVLSGTRAHAMGGSIAVGLNSGGQFSEVQVSFVADAILETDEANLTDTIYYVPGRVRDEVSMSEQEMIFIQRYDLGKRWMLLSAQNMYIESDMSEPSEQQYRLVEREFIGEESVNGMDTTKYKVIYESAKGKFGGFAWFTEDKIAVKAFLISEQDGEKQRIKFEITRLTRGPQDELLFELPAGSAKLDMTGMAGVGMPGLGEGSFADRMANVAKQAAEQEAETKVRNKVGRFFKNVFKN